MTKSRRLLPNLFLAALGVAVTGGKLHQAEAIAGEVKAHGLGIHRDSVAEGHVNRKITAVKVVRHGHSIKDARVA